MLNFNRTRTAPRSARSLSLGGLDYVDPKTKSNYVGKFLLAAALVALCILMLKQSPSFNSPSPFSNHEPGVTHVLVTGGAGYIGSHAALRLLKDSHRVTIVDNLSRGNMGAVKVLQELFPEPGRLQFIYADLGNAKAVNKIFTENAFDAVMHFAAVAYVGESTLDPLKYYHNITSNTLVVLEAMAAHGVKTLIYSSTCATYGEPEKMPITEETPQLPINPYGKAKKMAEDILLDFHKNSNMAVMILRYFNVIGSDPDGRLGEAPRPELREHGRISGACFDAARGIIPGLKVRGIDYKTPDGTCIRDYIDVTDLVDAHVKALEKAMPGKVGIYNVGTGRGRSVKEFVEACKKATGVNIKVDFLPRRPGDYAEVFSDPSKILLELNWTAQYTDLQKSLGIAWKWQKSHHNGYGTSVTIAAP
ncbi:UDP-arabinose 4-epimerase 1-like [Actinidia eriantha]|uniref:UDP-arabinose 4-epimerase 1-like n=1 Tax=Actinidia eriantha TaxID=165200 RepID=UPI00258EC83B|nr:UDP-arabinose 4-epimerase 1-like [Actinidia eriantha]XP_057472058.1 UDP-arabinose 4-epimerase 1-like [Actinidia eriantha]XP_057472059.1 UDP-arabinose 4-epimerase 1-like [Actinidia eriantha]XP_057472060.1 UDP-arabinose 4-epimerase 1-like [Actinidia eriantha]XP_057472061.1 UDP-arabinose 4-epimerase 1-like [Actinidia eriantha]XP_057472062.1 UDP-arabinose 4-epimerase 1-like [Actinidia eriantha]